MGRTTPEIVEKGQRAAPVRSIRTLRNLKTRGRLLIFVVVLAGCSDATEPTSASTPDPVEVLPPPSVANVSTVAELRTAVAEAPRRHQIIMAAGEYDLGNEGIRIENKSDLEISGAGRGKTVVRLGPDVLIGFNTAGDDAKITIAHMTIQGTLPSNVITNAIGSDNDRVALNGATFSDLEIRDVGIGISVASPRGGQCSEINIVGNYLDNIQDIVLADGSTRGSGIGIHNQNCWHVRIADNVIRNADRHGIYQAMGNGYRGSGVVIEHNLILDHATTPTIDHEYLVALAVARSMNVVVADNVIVGAAHDAMSLEDYEPGTSGGAAVTNVQFIHNTSIGAGRADLYLTAPGQFVFWGNRFAHRGEAGMTGRASIYAEGAGTPSSLIEPVGFQGTERIASSYPAGLMFLVQGGTVKASSSQFPSTGQSDPRNWPWTSMPGRPSTAIQDMTAGNGMLYLLAGDRLSEVDPRSWTRRDAPLSLTGTIAMGFSGSSLVVLAGGALHDINPRDWSDRVIGAAVTGTINGMAVFNGIAYIMANDVITAVDPHPPLTATSRLLGSAALPVSIGKH